MGGRTICAAAAAAAGGQLLVAASAGGVWCPAVRARQPLISQPHHRNLNFSTGTLPHVAVAQHWLWWVHDAQVQQPSWEPAQPAHHEPQAPAPLAGENVMNVVLVGAECAPWSKTGEPCTSIPAWLCFLGCVPMGSAARTGPIARAHGQAQACFPRPLLASAVHASRRVLVGASGSRTWRRGR